MWTPMTTTWRARHSSALISRRHAEAAACRPADFARAAVAREDDLVALVDNGDGPGVGEHAGLGAGIFGACGGVGGGERVALRSADGRGDGDHGEDAQKFDVHRFLRFVRLAIKTGGCQPPRALL